MNNPFALTEFFVYCQICQTDLRCSPFESLQIWSFQLGSQNFVSLWTCFCCCFNFSFLFFQKNKPDASIQISAEKILGYGTIKLYFQWASQNWWQWVFEDIWCIKERKSTTLLTLFTPHGRRRNEMSISTVCEYQQQFSCHIVKFFRQLVSAHLENRSAIFQMVKLKHDIPEQMFSSIQ